MRIAMLAAAAVLSFGHSAQAQVPAEDKQQTQAALDASIAALLWSLRMAVSEKHTEPNLRVSSPLMVQTSGADCRSKSEISASWLFRYKRVHLTD